MTSYETIRYERPTPAVVIAHLNRPDRMNAITPQMFDEFAWLQRDVESDADARALIITGTGRGFCAGLDLDVAAELPGMSAAEFLAKQEAWSRSVAGFRTMTKPMIAAVNGAAAGAGLSLALAADIRIAAPTARFNAAFVRIGLSGGDLGTSWFLPRVVGYGRAGEMLLTGRFVGAEEALRIGLVTEVTEAASLLDRAVETALAISNNSPVGMALTKHVLQFNVDAPSLEAALHVENRNQVIAAQTHDMAEALTAFREKRDPRFTGR